MTTSCNSFDKCQQLLKYKCTMINEMLWYLLFFPLFGTPQTGKEAVHFSKYNLYDKSICSLSPDTVLKADTYE